METLYSFETAVPYAEVDRDHFLQLPSVVKLLQEAAIGHANQWHAGTSLAERGETWVLNRLDVAISSYPRFGDKLRLETWSSGIRGFRGYREFRMYRGADCVLAASSLWLFFSLRQKVLVRVPHEILETFPSRPEAPVHTSHLDRRETEPPTTATAVRTHVSLRYADIDANGHVNNTAYFSFLQTALVEHGHPPRPHRIAIRFNREISPTAPSAEVLLAPGAHQLAFAIRADGLPCAAGSIQFEAPHASS